MEQCVLCVGDLLPLQTISEYFKVNQNGRTLPPELIDAFYLNSVAEP